MNSQSFNIPQFNSIIDNALKELGQEKQELKNEQNKLDTKINLLDWAKNCVSSIRDELSKAYDSINSQEKMIESLQAQLNKARAQHKKDALMAASVMEISKKSAELRIQLSEMNEKNEALAKDLEEEQRKNKILEMKLVETKKLSESLAQKASNEILTKVLRTYVNRSKGKSRDKRSYAKSAVLEIAIQNGLVLPEDLTEVIESLDDVQPDPKVVNVAGNYNDIHDNGTVNQK